LSFHKQQAEGIEVYLQADELELSINRAVPVGLILNEIATSMRLALTAADALALD
jgi:two-component sensor histidine kinase